MALRGSLADIGAVEILQLAHSGRKTGELVISGPSEARLYYERGNLVHAAMNDAVGIDVLVEVVRWSQAEFEFRNGTSTTLRTIQVDLPRAVMLALKLADERALSGQAAPEPSESRRVIAAERISQFAAQTPHVEYVCVDDPMGNLIAEAGTLIEPMDAFLKWKQALHGMLLVFPRKDVRRCFLTDPRGTVSVAVLDSGCVVVATSSSKASLGAVSVALTKLASSLP